MNEKDKKTLEDIRAFLKWAIDNGHCFMWALAQVGHDISGLLAGDPGFSPRTAGYSESGNKEANMAHLLYFRGEGKSLMRGVTEYVMLIDAASLKPGEIKGHTAPRFELHKDIEVDADITDLPCKRILIPWP
ncbi:MAG: hypothetical protein ABIH46_06755 [Chloroflexota bacterium]